MEAAVHSTVENFDRLDAAFNNAGLVIDEPVGLVEYAEEAWDKTIAVNLKGVWLGMKYQIPALLASGGGAIVNNASVMGVVAGCCCSYVASKHAVLGLTRSVAAEVAGTGVTANSVCPGYVRSDMTDRTIANISKHTTITLDEAERHLCASTPLGRLIEPAEVAHAVAFLATEEAGAINGQSIIIDGGAVQQ